MSVSWPISASWSAVSGGVGESLSRSFGTAAERAGTLVGQRLVEWRLGLLRRPLAVGLLAPDQSLRGRCPDRDQRSDSGRDLAGVEEAAIRKRSTAAGYG